MKRHRVRARFVVVVLTLVSHLMVAFGLPFPAAVARPAGDADAPYPCRDRPCGCLSAELCWAGDCCCFTLEEKLAWADANGFEPPEHVRPLVASRAGRGAAPERAGCCPDAAPCCEATDEECPSCAARPSPKPPAGELPEWRWVVGLFAQKCRAEGPAGLFHLDLVVVPLAISARVPSSPPVAFVPATPRPPASASHVPPTRPPRSA